MKINIIQKSDGLVIASAESLAEAEALVSLDPKNTKIDPVSLKEFEAFATYEDLPILNKAQLASAVEIMGLQDDIDNVFSDIENPIDKITTRNNFEQAYSYHANNPVLSSAIGKAGIVKDEFIQMWNWAALL